MFCKKCGHEFSEGAFCPSCGTRQDVQPVQQQYQQQQQQPLYQPAPPVQRKKTNTGAASLSLGIAGNIVAWLIPVVGLGLAVAGIITGGVSKSKGAGGMATAGIIISSIAVVMSILAWICATLAILSIM